MPPETLTLLTPLGAYVKVLKTVKAHRTASDPGFQ